ncbi:MAG TPA: OmpH family outer membrane protein [Bacteroides sp.]|nr:OmpH family outer membrane protein [Bacteroides sp.]
MKTTNIVTSAVLAAAIIVLYVLHFTGKDRGGNIDGSAAAEERADTTDVQIAYFNMDSVMAQWDLYYKYQQELGKRQAELESDFAGKTETFYKSVEDAQYKIQRGLVTRKEAEELQQQLASQEQNLMSLQNRYSQELQEEGLVRNRKMLDMIERYVSEISKRRGYDYVYSYSFGGNLIYGAKPYDITDDVVKGLNERYGKDYAVD